jgi:hypothetical protein
MVDSYWRATLYVENRKGKRAVEIRTARAEID